MAAIIFLLIIIFNI